MSILRKIGLSNRIPIVRDARQRCKVFAGKKEAFKRYSSNQNIFTPWSPEFLKSYLGCGLLEKDPHTAVLKCDPEIEAQIFESAPIDLWSYAKKFNARCC